MAGAPIYSKQGDPGVYVIPELGKEVKIVDLDEHDFFDVQVLAAGALAANSVLEYFATISSTKKLIDQNVKTARKIPGGEAFLLRRVGVHCPGAVGNTTPAPSDLKKAYENGFLDLRINDDVVCDGPLTRFPSGYGLVGTTNESDQGFVTNGVASTVAAQLRMREQAINEKHELSATITYYDHVWDATNMPTFLTKVWVRLHLHGLRERAKGRG